MTPVFQDFADKSNTVQNQRLAILVVAHIGNAMDRQDVQSILARWIACGELSESDWNTIRFIASVNLSPPLQEQVKASYGG